MSVSSIGLMAGALCGAFSYNPPGVLHEGSGTGKRDDRLWFAGTRFPIEEAPAFANSQVWGRGGMYGPGGNECDAANFVYPWSDNYCESRSWDMPLCPSGTGHQGQDIRAQSCGNKVHWAVAVADGSITSIGTYTLSLVADDGIRYRYLHMDPATLAVEVGDEVVRGERLGLVSDAFGDSSTTVHLHFDVYDAVSGVGSVYLPTYMSLVRAYEDLTGEDGWACPTLPAGGGIIDDELPCFRVLGPPASWRIVEDDGHGGRLHWTNAWTSATPGNWAEWRLNVASAGLYRLEVYIADAYGGSTAAPYVVTHGGVDTEVEVDVSTAAGWIELGTFALAGDGDDVLALYDNTGESSALQRHIPADAVRLTLVGTAPSDGGPVGGDGGSDSGPTAGDPHAADPGPSGPTGATGPGHSDDDSSGGNDAGGDGDRPFVDDEQLPPSGCDCRSTPSGLWAMVLGLALLRRSSGTRRRPWTDPTPPSPSRSA